MWSISEHLFISMSHEVVKADAPKKARGFIAKNAFVIQSIIAVALLFGGQTITFADTASHCLAQTSCDANGICGLQNTTSINLYFRNQGTFKPYDVLVVMVAYTNQANTGKITVSGMNATWTAGYAPPLQQGIGVAFFYGTNPDTTKTITISVPNTDTLAGFAQAWENLTVTEDPGSQAAANGTGSNPAVSGATSNANDVVFNFVAYSPSAPPSPPLGPFQANEKGNNRFAPYITGGFSIASTAGQYSNGFTLHSTNKSLKWISAAVALESAEPSNALFYQTALTDYTPGQLYLGLYPGFLYNNSNSPDSAHDADGRNLALEIQPLDAQGNPSPTGKIGFMGIGPSNFTQELCTGADITAQNVGKCDDSTFFDQASKLTNINPSLVLIDCAKGDEFIGDWLDLTSLGWQECLNTRLPVYGITPQQVQVVTFYDDVRNSKVPLANMAGSTCPDVPVAGRNPDACVYEYDMGQLMRLLKTEFPNMKMLFLQSITYAGYAGLEPVRYELGFSTKWLIQAQVNEEENPGFIDPLAGDVSYSDGSTAWMAWSAYTWGPGPIPRDDGQSWPAWNFNFDGVHPSVCFFYGIECGRMHSADLMMAFYTTSPYTTPWFLAATPAATKKTP
jgi:hypothetical protein